MVDLKPFKIAFKEEEFLDLGIESRRSPSDARICLFTVLLNPVVYQLRSLLPEEYMGSYHNSDANVSGLC